ncbi:putative hydrolase YugF [Cucumis melo var. makuwa]|uniref:Hydrolase YugF n=1 Tax=Cucumis melo var. makuwa TaxID=1194695 RepID=A0A5D3C9J9_CUCMM|nr:putative hydrolase YugF [Cucumis melo var. makuwa]TYK08541.1 putative hydrolase YugF [Cucumis melo var. makuwa]
MSLRIQSSFGVVLVVIEGRPHSQRYPSKRAQQQHCSIPNFVLLPLLLLNLLPCRFKLSLAEENTTPFPLFLSLSLSTKPTYTTHSLHPSTHFLHPSTHHPIFTTVAPPLERQTPALELSAREDPKATQIEVVKQINLGSCDPDNTLVEVIAFRYWVKVAMVVLSKTEDKTRPMVIVRPSLGAAVAIHIVVNYQEVVDRLVLIDASVYAKGTGNLATLPRLIAYAGVRLCLLL